MGPRIENGRQGAHLLFCWRKCLLPLWGSSTYWRVTGQHMGQLLKDTEKAATMAPQANSWARGRQEPEVWSGLWSRNTLEVFGVKKQTNNFPSLIIKKKCRFMIENT